MKTVNKMAMIVAALATGALSGQECHHVIRVREPEIHISRNERRAQKNRAAKQARKRNRRK